MRTWHVEDVMTVDVVTVEETTPYREIVDALTAHRVSAAPVVDQDRRVVGVVSEADLLHKPGTTLTTAAKLMNEMGVNLGRLP